MLKLKSKLFDLLARNISIEDFEQWLYNDKEILSKVDSDDFVLELIDRDYKSKHIIADLEKICFDNFSKGEFLIFTIENACNLLSEEKNYNVIFNELNQIVTHYYFDEDYGLLFNFYCLHSETDCGYFNSQERKIFVDKINKYTTKIMLKFQGKSFDEKMCFIKNGIETM